MRAHVIPTSKRQMTSLSPVLQEKLGTLKKSSRFKKQYNNFARASHFLYISMPFLHDYGVKMPNLAFMENLNEQGRNFICLSDPGYGP